MIYNVYMKESIYTDHAPTLELDREAERKAELERAILSAADRFLSPEAFRQRSKLSP